MAIAVHARTVEQHYAGDARWDAIGELKAHVTSIPVLGNGDIWEAVDAVADDAGDGLRRRRRRTRLPRPAVAVRRPARRARRPAGAGVTSARRSPTAVMVDHARALVDHHADDGGEPIAMRTFRKHASWYLTGYPVGSEVRRRAAQVSIARRARRPRRPSSIRRATRRRGRRADPARATPTGRSRSRCRTASSTIPTRLEHDLTVPDDDDVMALSGG